MFSIKAQIILWLVAALVVAPLIETLGLNRPRGADKHLSPDELEQVWRYRLRQAFEFLATIGGTLGILYLMQRGMRDGPNVLYGLVVVILWTFGFIITMVVVAIVAHFLNGRIRTGYHLVLCALFVFGFALPLTFDRAQASSVAEKRASIATEYMDMQKGLRTQWRKDVEAAGAHGGAGVVPPMLQVLDSGDGVQVTNIGDETICLDLRRSLARLGPGFDYQCALWSERGMLHSCVKYPPGHTEWLRMSSKRPDLPDCSGESLEFRVGNWKEESIGWWSDAALEEFDRQTGQAARETTQFDPAEMRSDSFMREVMNELQAREVGVSRVARWLMQLNAADEKRASLGAAPAVDQFEQARQLNVLREAQAHLQAVKNLRQRLSRRRADERAQVFPDYLPVEDRLDSATVTHPLGAVFYVRLARVGRDSTGQEYVCEMRGLGRGTEFGTYVSNGQPGQFTLASREGLCAEPAKSTLEMVVHDFDGRLTFASPGALDRLEAEANARVLALAPGSIL